MTLKVVSFQNEQGTRKDIVFTYRYANKGTLFKRFNASDLYYRSIFSLNRLLSPYKPRLKQKTGNLKKDVKFF